MSSDLHSIERANFQVPRVLSKPVQAPIQKNYDPVSGEGWKLTKALLEERLGPDDFNNRYTRRPPGASRAGFQEEFALGVWQTDQTQITVNLVLKGIIAHSGGMDLWMATQYALVGRYTPEAQIAFIATMGGLSHPDLHGSQQDSFFDPLAPYGQIGYAKVARIVDCLRRVSA